MNMEPIGRRPGRPKRLQTGPITAARALLYDLPELHAAQDALWQAVQERVPVFATAPRYLSRNPGDEWENTAFGQTCGYRYATRLAEAVHLIATPRYGVKGTDGPFVRSVVVVGRRQAATGLADLRGQKLALDQGDLNSINLLRAEVAPLAANRRFFGALQSHASFLDAANAVVEERADAALLDGVAFALLERTRPELTSRLRILLWTTRSPGPPIITAKTVGADGAEQARRALIEISLEPEFATLRQDLLITGFNLLPKPQYRAVSHLEQIAQAQNYPRLC